MSQPGQLTPPQVVFSESNSASLFGAVDSQHVGDDIARPTPSNEEHSR
jgi:hypothetical protein